MRRRTVIILVGVLAVGGMGASLAGVLRPFEVGPRYKGLPLSYWRSAVAIRYWDSKPSLSRRLETLCGLREKSGRPIIFRGDPAAAPVLLRLRRDPTTQFNVIRDMFAAYDSTSPPNPFLKAEFVKAVTAQLRNPNREARREAMDFLRSTWHKASSETVAGLIGTLQDEDADVRAKSIAMLGEIGPQARPAVPSLLALLNDKSVSAEAAEALRQIDPEAAERAGVK